MAFVGIEFAAEPGKATTAVGQVGLVHSSWLTPMKQEVWWPPQKLQSKFEKLLRRGEPPSEDTWEIHKIRRCFFEEDDYLKAREKCKLSEITSDLQSEDQEPEVSKKKRKLTAKKILSSDSSDDDRENYIVSRLPMPPKIKDVTIRQFDRSGANSFPPNENATLSSAHSRNTPSTSFKKPSACPGLATPLGTPKTASQAESETETRGSFQDQVLEYLVTIRAQNRQILKLLNGSNNIALKNFELPEDLKLTLPLKSFAELTTLEEYLTDNSNLAAVASYLSGIGGRDPTSKTNAILRHLLTNKLASKFSFLGTRNEKRAFAELKIRKVLVRAVQLTCKDITEGEIDKFTKDWLKHAPKRFQHDMKRIGGEFGEETN